VEWIAVNTTEAWMVVDGLKVGATYAVRVRAYTNVGSGPWADTIFVQTAPEGSSKHVNIIIIIIIISVRGS